MPEYDGNTSRQTIALNGSADVPAPLYGCVICCTSVPDEKRTQLAEYAKQMGAVHTYDLTLDATHLIVGEYDTEKFRYVAQKRLDVQPMMISWIEAVRELWINDQEIDMPLLERQHRMPTFHSLRFSMTGCDDPTERLEIAAQVKANGATYEGDLTKSITHLISFRTEGAKYKAAKSWKLKIVSIEWVRDSLERGMILDEKLYDPALPPSERGKDAWDKTAPRRRTSLGKRSREESTASLDGGRRKLRRTASTKLSTQNEQIWGDIVGGGATGGNITQVNRSGVWGQNDEETTRPDPRPTNPKENQTIPSMQSTIENNRPLDEMFTGCRFHTHGFPPERIQILHNHLFSNGAEVVETVEDLVKESAQYKPNRLFRMIPHDLPASECPPLPASQLPIETITFWWLERCLHHKKFMDPNDHVIGRPFPVFPIDGFSGMVISSSAFAGIDLLHFQRAIELLGAKYSEEFTPNSSVLVTKSMAGLRKDKFDTAQEWKIPILNADWVWDSISAGTKQPTSKYRCRSQKRSDSLPNTGGSRPSTGHNRTNSELPRTAPKTTSLSSKSSMRPPPNAGLDNTAFSTEGSSSKSAMKPPPIAGLDSTAFSTESPPGEPAEASKKPVRKSKRDKTAFIFDEPAEDMVHNVPDVEDPSPETLPKEEHHTQGFPSVPDICPTASEDVSHDLAYKSKPLAEIDGNSPTRTVSTAPAPSDHPAPRQEEGLNIAISSLLAKAKTAPVHSAPEPRKRGRIIGRVPSNLSTGSNRSRDTSVDSTATHGHPVEYPPYNNDSTPNEKIQMLLNGDKPTEAVDSQPPATQLQYEDTESNEAREVLMAKMRGEKVERRGLKEKSVTLGDYVEQPRNTRRAGRTGLR